ncbi:MAG: hypothetical protein JWL91_204 [Sphingomonas bacterium]|nr:hypothetical protein [Sphingomonas bacterium]
MSRRQVGDGKHQRLTVGGVAAETLHEVAAILDAAAQNIEPLQGAGP